MHPLNLLLYIYFFYGVAQNSESLHSPQRPNNNKPNFIVILADDRGYGDISCYGNKQIQTPNFDQMARQAIRFVDFHSIGAVCSPTRVAPLTLFWDTGKSIAARKGRWKLVIPEQNSKPELYDLEKDLEEMDNVADQNPSIVNELFSEIKEWKVNVNKGVKKIS